MPICVENLLILSSLEHPDTPSTLKTGSKLNPGTRSEATRVQKKAWLITQKGCLAQISVGPSVTQRCNKNKIMLG